MNNEKLKLRKNISIALYAINAVISLTLGFIYIFRDGFMSYHSAALQQSWDQLEVHLQVLFKALMMVAGAGWVTLSIAIFFILIFAFRLNIKWSGYAVPILILTFYVPTLIATLTVLKSTPSTPPWYGNAIACITTILAYIIYRPSLMKKAKL